MTEDTLRLMWNRNIIRHITDILRNSRRKKIFWGIVLGSSLLVTRPDGTGRSLYIPHHPDWTDIYCGWDLYTSLINTALWLSLQRIITKAKSAFVMTIIAHFSDKITLHRKYAPGEYEEEVYYNIYVPSVSEHSRRSTETLCGRNVLITNTMLFHTQNMFHFEICS